MKGSTKLDWLTLAAGAVLAFWALLALDRKRWWPGSAALRGPRSREAEWFRGEEPLPEQVLVVIPARDEAVALAAALPPLLAQGRCFASLVVVDDGSTDGTAAVARQAAAASLASGKVLVAPGSPPPPGWSGKLHALALGLSAASAGRMKAGTPLPEWVLFTDADIAHPPDSLARLLAKAREGPFDLVSVMVRLRVESIWERLLMPPFVYFFQLLYPFRRVADPRSRVSAAAGGCLLIKRELLERLGGLESIAGAVIDDVALAKKAKAAGGKCWLGLDPEMVSLRGYGGLRGVVQMVARTAFVQLDFSLFLLGGALAFLAFFAAPPFLALLALARGEGAALALALAAWGLETATFLPAVRHHRLRAPWSLTLPLAALLFGYMTCVSALRHWRGRGIEWKGRRFSQGIDP